MDIASEIVLARIGSYGPHIVTSIIGVATYLLIVKRLKPSILHAFALAVFGWQLEEGLFAYFLFAMRQLQGYPGLSYIVSYVIGGSTLLTLSAVAVGLYFFHDMMKLSPLWLGFATVAAIWAFMGAPTSLDTGTSVAFFSSSVSVSLLEELWIAAFALAFYDSFRYPK